MPAIRKPLRKRFEDRSWVVRFRHPLSQKVVRVSLGHDQREADGKLLELNRVFMDSAQWAKPRELSKDLFDAWNGGKSGVRVSKNGVAVNGQEIKTSDATTAGLMSVIEELTSDLAASRAEATKYRKQLEQVLGRKVRVGPVPTLRESQVQSSICRTR
jgi:hypothetical protein